MLPRKSDIETIDYLQDELDLVDIWRIKNPFLRFWLEPFGGLFLFHCKFSIPSYFNGGLSFVVFSIVEGNVNIFCGITKRYVLIISLFSIKNFLNKMSFS